LENLNVDDCCARLPDLRQLELGDLRVIRGFPICRAKALEESRAKYATSNRGEVD